jgi:predicted nucleic acid-binding protein
VKQDRLFLDASAWRAYLDEGNQHHTEAVTRIREARGKLLTSYRALEELTSTAGDQLDKARVADLVWDITSTRTKSVLRTTGKDERHAWGIFRGLSGPHPSYTDCTNMILLAKYKISQWLTFTPWFPRTTEQLDGYLESTNSL